MNAYFFFGSGGGGLGGAGWGSDCTPPLLKISLIFARLNKIITKYFKIIIDIFKKRSMIQ